MAHIPQAVLARFLTVLVGLVLRSRGKVRDTYDLPGFPEYMLVVASNRISVFDFVLNALVPQKGEILNALNIFWRIHFKGKFRSDLVAFGSDIDQYLPKALQGNIELWKTAVVVKKIDVIPIEGIVRGYITGGAIKEYNKQKGVRPRVVFNTEMSEGLTDGSPLESPWFTPTTKAEVGHDMPIAAKVVREKYGADFENMCVLLYKEAAVYALERDIILADTKFEGDEDGLLGDEWLTPDSSRYWERKAYDLAKAKGKLPASLDKQFVRNLLEEILKGLGPDNPADLARADVLAVSDEAIRMTTAIYRYIFWRLTGLTLEQFQRQFMGVQIEDRKLKIEVVVGSRSDLTQILDGWDFLKKSGHSFNVSVLSCHRNADVLPSVVADKLSKADRIIACAGKAAALPGILKSQLSLLGYSDIPVIGVALEGDTHKADQAAILSIEELPEQ
ncbi:TPA: hypothetical protein DCQ44_01045, partial [Candidatus Taylorbacteria bacterium]|nr:hypothetical protein [Candidatus Taylorbacteria bacterium]